MAYRNTFFRWLFLYSLTFGLTYVLKLFTYLCPETGQVKNGFPGRDLREKRIDSAMRNKLTHDILSAQPNVLGYAQQVSQGIPSARVQLFPHIPHRRFTSAAPVFSPSRGKRLLLPGCVQLPEPDIGMSGSVLLLLVGVK